MQRLDSPAWPAMTRATSSRTSSKRRSRKTSPTDPEELDEAASPGRPVNPPIRTVQAPQPPTLQPARRLDGLRDRTTRNATFGPRHRRRSDVDQREARTAMTTRNPIGDEAHESAATDLTDLTVGNHGPRPRDGPATCNTRFVCRHTSRSPRPGPLLQVGASASGPAIDRPPCAVAAPLPGSDTNRSGRRP